MQHFGTVPLETERLLLRPYRRTDAPAIFNNWANDPEVTKYLSWRAHANCKITQDVVDGWCDHETLKTYRWAITLKKVSFPEAEPDEPVGSIDIVHIDTEGWGEMGWVLSRRYWAKGIMTEAARAVFHYLFEEVGFPELRALHDVDNPASGQVMRKIGMHCVGQSEKELTNNQGLPCTAAEYRLTRPEFDQLAIRPAYHWEISEVARLYEAVCQALLVPGVEGPGWKSGVYPVKEDAADAHGKGQLYVALRTGKIVGTVILNDEQPAAYAEVGWHYPAERAVVIHTLAVHPEARGGGVAAALLAYGEAYARGNGISVVRLDTYEKNIPAQRLYERCGYLRSEDVDLGIGEIFGLYNFYTYEKDVG